MAGTTVTTTIRVVGEDRASRPIRAVREELDQAAKSALHTAEKSGDIEKGFRGVKDVLGGLGAGPLQEVSDSFGGIENLIKGFGPALGPFAVTIAAAGAAASVLYSEFKRVKEAGINAQIAQLKYLQEDTAALARHLSVDQESLGIKQKALDSQDLMNQRLEIAKKIVQDEIAAKEAQKSGDDKALANAERDVEYGKSRLSTLAIELDFAKQIEKEDEQDAIRVLAKRDAIGSVIDRQRQIDLMVENQFKITAQLTLNADKRQILEGKLHTLQLQQNNAQTATLEAAQQILKIKEAIFGIDKEEIALNQKDAQSAEAKQAKAKAAHDAVVARRKVLRDANAAFAAAEVQDLEAQFQARKEIGNREVLAAAEQAKAEQEAKQAARVSAQGLTTDPAEKARLQLVELEIEQTERQDAAEKNLTLNRATRAAMLVAIEQESNGKRLTILSAESARKKQAANQEIDMGFAVAQAAVAGLEQIGVGERAAAGLKAILAAAEGALAYTRGRYDQAVAGAFAAIQFGSIALGAGSTPSAPTAGGGSGFASQTAQIGASQSSGSSGPVVVNFSRGFVVGTSQDVGKAVSKAVKSIGSTGYAQKQAA